MQMNKQVTLLFWDVLMLHKRDCNSWYSVSGLIQSYKNVQL